MTCWVNRLGKLPWHVCTNFQGLITWKITALKLRMKRRNTHEFLSGLKMDGRRIWAASIDRRRFKIWVIRLNVKALTTTTTTTTSFIKSWVKIHRFVLYIYKLSLIHRLMDLLIALNVDGITCSGRIFKGHTLIK